MNVSKLFFPFFTSKRGNTAPLPGKKFTLLLHWHQPGFCLVAPNLWQLSPAGTAGPNNEENTMETSPALRVCAALQRRALKSWESWSVTSSKLLWCLSPCVFHLCGRRQVCLRSDSTYLKRAAAGSPEVCRIVWCLKYPKLEPISAIYGYFNLDTLIKLLLSGNITCKGKVVLNVSAL